MAIYKRKLFITSVSNSESGKHVRSSTHLLIVSFQNTIKRFTCVYQFMIHEYAPVNVTAKNINETNIYVCIIYM